MTKQRASVKTRMDALEEQLGEAEARIVSMVELFQNHADRLRKLEDFAHAVQKKAEAGALEVDETETPH